MTLTLKNSSTALTSFWKVLISSCIVDLSERCV